MYLMARCLSINVSSVTFIKEVWTYAGILHFRFSTNAIKSEFYKINPRLIGHVAVKLIVD